MTIEAAEKKTIVWIINKLEYNKDFNPEVFSQQITVFINAEKNAMVVQSNHYSKRLCSGVKWKPQVLLIKGSMKCKNPQK